ncbi:hypothetical protein [Sphingobium sp. AntQ-1]|uniref:hypothetical protein n=1 Tax=Sphingobium sp. AntQ-1 TaxID=2930091 RepID=UPI00234F0547|nr:hypothetical protein [Sphingobium sp. AntQ-1]
MSRAAKSYFDEKYSPALKVVAGEGRAIRQFAIQNDTPRFDDFDRQYVEISGFFGEHSPHTFAEAPALLAMLRRWAALEAGAWHVDRHAAEKTRLMAETRALISKAEGLGA